MRPIKLTLSGLNSYTDEQVINFEELIDRGLFGIFGNTGSGKSTILDAITIAMYGNISRNTKEFINSSCKEAVVTYEFEIGGKNTKRRYEVTRIIGRSKAGGTKTTYARLIEKQNDGTEIILADKAKDVNDKITQVVGLTANDFTRSVVLPQGKFNEFLKLTGSDRRDMLERIFNLEKYGRGLIDKVRKRKNEANLDLRDLNTKMSQFEGISPELYDNTLKELEDLKKNEKNKHEKLDETQKLYEESKEIYEEQTKLESYEVRKKELDLKQNDIKDKKVQLENAENAERVNPSIYIVQELEKKINDDSLKIEEIERNLGILNQELTITKNRYEEAYKTKDEKMPRLMEHKEKLNNALKIEEELNIINEEIKEMKERGIGLSKEKKISEIQKKDVEAKRDVIVKNIKEKEDKINKLKISADLKQKIFLAYDYEKEYLKLGEEKSQKQDRLNNLTKEVEELNLKSKYIEKDRISTNSKLDDLIISQAALIKKCPGTNEEILSKTEYISELKNTYNTVKENEQKINKLQDEINIILEKKYNNNREIDVISERVEVNRKEIQDLEKEIERLKYLNLASELRKDLKPDMPCPVCGSRHHENIEFINKNEEINFVKSKLEHYEEIDRTLRTNLEELNLKNSEYISGEKIKSKELKELKGKVGELKSIDLSSKLESENRILELLKNSVQNWNEEKESIEERISKLKEEKSKIEKDEVKILEEINSYRKSIKEIKSDLEEIELKYQNVKNEYLSLKAIVKVSNLSSKVEEINLNEKEIESINSEYTVLVSSKDNAENEIKSLDNKIHKTELELIKARELYAEKCRFRDEKYRDFISITKGESAKELLQKLEDYVENINKLEVELKNKLEIQRIEYETCLGDKKNIEGRLKTAKDHHKIQEQTLNQLLSDNKFENIYAVKRALLEYDHKKRLLEEILEYEEEQRILISKIEGLKHKLAGRLIKKEEFEELKNNIYILKIEINSISKEIGAKENILNSLKDSLDKIKEITKLLKKVQHKVDLLEDLDKIIQGNRFVEYVATNQLKYIALEASKRLESITKGRYALEIDQKLNFVMRDNFNGGERRSVDTLSGGETFLTSLSLALALSSQIQLKGSAPLEFFFLDEGFGSLDSDLLDIVMQSLERLHSDKLSVGIISHVEELKNRVPVKLVVTSSEAGSGSKVKIEYS